MTYINQSPICAKAINAFKVIAPILALVTLTNCASSSYQAPRNYNTSSSEYARYNGYCYQNNNTNTRTKGTVIGAVAGGILGSQVAADGNRTEGTILGAVVGGIVGSQIAAEVKETENSHCRNNDYYLYNNGYYDPAPPPSGYRVAYFYERPSGRRYHYDRRR